MTSSRAAVIALALTPVLLGAQPRHYVFFGQDREKVPSAVAFFATPKFEGAQISYTWRRLEPRKDEYDFSGIREDLALLESRGKKLWIQLQDVTFSQQYRPAPQYLLDDSTYHGGIARQYSNDTGAGGGWVTRRWDPAVQARLAKLFDALGREFDGKITGINLAETSVEFGPNDAHVPFGFSPATYVDAVVTNMRALKRAFPKSIAMQYANFMAGEWRPTDNRGYLDSVYAAARKLGVGVGGPDLLPNRPGQVQGAHPLIRESRGIIPTGIAVQDGNLAEVDRATGKKATAESLKRYAADVLGVDFIFWGTEEPWFSAEVVPLIARKRSPDPLEPRSWR